MSESLENRITKIETTLAEIQARNQKVERDKAWETSLARRSLLFLTTYILTALVFYLIGVENFLANALVPSIAYFLSTLAVPRLKRHWLSRLS